MTTDQNTTKDTAVPDEGRHHFHETLGHIRQELVTMGSLVLENVQRAGIAMTEARLDLVDEVRQADAVIDAMYVDIERLTFETLARQQPVAKDLRFLVATTRILYDLERSGDLAVNCVKMVERVDGFPDQSVVTPLLEASVRASCKVFAMGVDALADMEPDAYRILDRADDEVDDLVNDFYTAVGRHSDEIGLETAVGFSRVGRFLERIADHAVAIGDNVTYVVTAELPTA